jgi:hypothetical protein
MLRVAVHPGIVDEYPIATRNRAEEDVPCHVERVDDGEVLVDGRDSRPQGVGGGLEVQRLAVHQQLSRVGLVDTREDLHESALSSAVVAEQRDHFPMPDRETDRAESVDMTE